jgi:hypothetical protein
MPRRRDEQTLDCPDKSADQDQNYPAPKLTPGILTRRAAPRVQLTYEENQKIQLNNEESRPLF